MTEAFILLVVAALALPTDIPPPTMPPCGVGGLELIPPEEFFLDLFIERYKVPGGYQVRRFQGSEFFDLERERSVERRRNQYEARLSAAFYASGLPATPLNKITSPFRDAPHKFTGFKVPRARRRNKTAPPGFSAHKAYDIIVKEGTPVHPIGTGIVVAVEGNWWQKINDGIPIRVDRRSWWDEIHVTDRPISMKSGNFVLIYHPPKKGSGSKGYYSFYAHMEENPPVELGQIVTPNDTIGFVEHSGYNAMINGHGGHLHLSVEKDLGKGYLEPIRFANYFRRPHSSTARRK
jgi:murein DD-endopeptidase MepM/ murein hydrolase activator NlpD